MKYKIFQLFLVFLFVSLFTLTPLLPCLAKSYGLESSADQTNGLVKEEDPSPIIGSLIGTILAFVGVLFFILVIYGGLLWMTARGNEQQIEKAKNLIGSAIVGLIIVLSAYAITAFIGRTLTG